MDWGWYRARWWKAKRLQRRPEHRESLERLGDQGGGRSFFILLIIATTTVILVSFYVPVGPGDRLAVLVLVLMVISIGAFFVLYRVGVKVPPLEKPAVARRVNEGGLGRLAETLGRADRGMRFSQVLVARRVREAFLTRLAFERDLPRDELDSRLAQPDELQRIVADPYLQAFLEDTAPAEELLIKGEGPGGPARFRFAKKGGFTAGIAQVLQAVEEWH